MPVSVFDFARGFIKSRCYEYKNLAKPIHVAISGGRSSAVLLALLLEIHDGKLPSNYYLVFTNTGKEHPATYAFLKDIETHWGVELILLEMTAVLDRDHVAYRRCSHAELSQNGAPFQALLRDLAIVPKRNKRLCTFYMKSMTSDQYFIEQGIPIAIKMLGFRADEGHRLAKMLFTCGRERKKIDCVPHAPLIQAAIHKDGVLDFFKQQPFDLQIHSNWGNCDFCFLKGRKKLIALARDNPERLEWWVKYDTGRILPSGQRMYMLPEGGYAGLKLAAFRPLGNDDDEDGLEDIECNCTD